MSTWIGIYCDGEGCHRGSELQLIFEDDEAGCDQCRQMHDTMHGDGWVCLGAKHYCPACAWQRTNSSERGSR